MESDQVNYYTSPCNNNSNSKKKKNTRRISREENANAIRDVIKKTQKQHVSLEEFIGLVSQYTGDRGRVLMQVITEDLNSFRKMVYQVYETMTEDISDVLANEQTELSNTHVLKYRSIIKKIINTCKELKDIVPSFNFEDYYQDPEGYVKRSFVVAEIPEDDEDDVLKRQLALHRLQWLQSESERLKKENQKLKEKASGLKQQQRLCLRNAVKYEIQVENTHVDLTEVEYAFQKRLNQLNQIIQERILEAEELATKRKVILAKEFGKAKKQEKLKKVPEVVEPQRGSAGDAWNVKAAKQIEREHFSRYVKSKIISLKYSVDDACQKSAVKHDFKSMKELVKTLDNSLESRHRAPRY